MARPPKVSSYLRNVGKSIAYSAVEVLKGTTPATNDFVDNNKELFKEVYAATKNYKQTLKKIGRTFKASKPYQALDAGWKAGWEDLKSGQWYNKERKERYEMEALGFNMDDFNFDMDFDMDDNWDMDDDEPALSDAEMIDGTIMSAAQGQIESFSQNADYIVQNSRINTKIAYMQQDKIFNAVTSGFSSISSTVSSINEAVKGPLQTHLENSTKYYQETTKIFQENNAIIKELLEMQRNLYNEKETKYEKSDWDNVVSGNGALDIKEYIKTIQKNINNVMSNSGMDIIFGDGFGKDSNMLKAVMGSPLSYGLAAMFHLLIPEAMKESMRNLDSGIGSLFTNAMSRLRAKGDQDPWGFWGMVSNILGIDPNKSYSERTFDTTRFEKGPVPFDGIVRKSIIEVIPGYLARIESILGGKPQNVFDMETGRWKDINTINREYNETINSYKVGSTYSIRSKIERDYINKLEGNDEDKKEIRNKVDKMLSTVFNDGYLDFKKGAEHYGLGDTRENKELFNIIQTLLYEDREGREAIRALDNNIRNYKKYINDFIQRSAEGNSPYNWIFNGTEYDLNSSGKVITREQAKKRKEESEWSDVREAVSNGQMSLRELLELLKVQQVDDDITDDSNNRRRGRKGKKSRRSKGKNNNDNKKENDNKDEEKKEEKKSTETDAEQGAKILEERRKKEEKEKAKKNWMYGFLSDRYDIDFEKGNIVKQIAESTKDKGPFSKAIGSLAGSIYGLSKIFEAPGNKIAEIFDKADKKLFAFMFGGDETHKIKDKDGNEVKVGLAQYAVYKLEDLFKNAMDKLDEIFKRFKESKIGKWLDETTKSFREGFKEKFKLKGKNIFESIKSSVVDTSDEVRNKLAYIDLGNQFNGVLPQEIIDLYKYNPNFIRMYRSQLGKNARGVYEAGNFAKIYENYIKDKYSTDSRFEQLLQERLKDKSDYNHNDIDNIRREYLRMIKDDDQETKDKTRNKTKDRDILKEVLNKMGISSSDVAEVDEKDNEEDKGINAEGGLVTKGGLTFISPGERILPSSKDPDIIARQKEKEKRLRDKIFGKRSNVPLNAEGTDGLDAEIESEESKKKAKEEKRNRIKEVFEDFKNKKIKLDDVFDELRKINPKAMTNMDKVTDVASSGAIGGLLGLLVFHPILGAAVGAGSSIVKNSKTVQRYLFGEEDENGERKDNGLIPKHIVDKVTKITKNYLPDFKKYGIAGGLAGLITPLGLLGGIGLGAGVTLLKNNEKFNKYVFGSGEYDDGLLSKAFQEKVKKAMPRMAVGAVGAAILGPFGLLGNAAMGAGLGLFSTTEMFKTILLGRESENGERDGGLVNAIKSTIIDPVAETIKESAKSFKEYFQKEILDNLKKFIGPFGQMIKNGIKAIQNDITLFLRKTFDWYVGRPMGMFFKKLTNPIGKFVNGVLKAGIGITKNVVATPFRAIGAVGDHIRQKQILKGTAGRSTAAERLQEREKVKNSKRFTKLGNAALDPSLKMDQFLARASQDQIIQLNELLNGKNRDRDIATAEAEHKKNLRSMQANAKDVYNTLGIRKEGMFALDREGLNWFDRLEKAAKTSLDDGNIDKFMKVLNQRDIGLDEEQKKKFLNAYDFDKLRESKARADFARKGRDVVEQELAKEIGIDPKNLYRFRDYVGYESDAIKKQQKKEKEAESLNEEELRMKNMREEENKYRDDIREKAQSMIDSIVETNSILKYIAEGGNVSLEDYLKSKRKKTSSTSTGDNKEDSPEEAVDNVDSQDTDNDAKDQEGSIENTEREQEEKKRKGFFERILIATEENARHSSILSKIFGNKKEKKNRGILGNITDAIANSKAGKLVKTGIFAALGFSLMGYGSEFLKTKVWPGVRGFLFGEKDADGNRTKYGLLTGITTAIIGDKNKDGLLQKLCGWLGDKFNAIKEWYMGEGGISGILLNRVLPKLITGWGYAVDNIVAPLVAMTIKALPHIAVGLVKGIVSGLKLAVFNKKLTRSNTIDMNTSSILKEVSNTSSSKQSALASSMGNLGNSVKNAFTVDTSVYSSDLSNMNISELFGDEDKENKETDIFGATKRSNEVKFDDDGNITTDYTQFNKTDSLFSTIGKSSAKSFVRAAAGMKSGGPISLLKKIKMGGKGIKEFTKIGLLKNGVKGALKGTGSAISASSKAGDVVNKAIQNAAENGVGKVTGSGIINGLKKIFSTFFNSSWGKKIINFAAKITGTEGTEIALKKAFDIVAKVLGDTLLGKLANNSLKMVAKAISGFSPVGIAFLVHDFMKGFNNSETYLGVIKDGDYKVSMGMKIVCGFANMLNEKFTLGLIPIGTIMDIIIEHVMPLFHIDTDELNSARDRAANEMDQWNIEHPEDTYDNLEDFNKRNKPTSVVKRALKKVTSFVKGENKTNKTEQTDENNNSKSKLDLYKDYFGKLFSGDIKEAIMMPAADENDPDALMKNIEFNIAKVVTAPIGNIVSVLGLIKEPLDETIKLFKKVDQTYKTDLNKIERANKGEISVFSSEYWSTGNYKDYGVFGTVGYVGSLIQKVINAPFAFIRSIGSKIFSAFESIKDWFSEKFGGIWSWAKDIFGVFTGDNAKQVEEKLKEAENAGKGRKDIGFGHINQKNPNIANMKYGNSTIGEAGCGPVAATNLINRAYGRGMTVDKAAQYAQNNGFTDKSGGTNMEYFNSILNNQGIPNKNSKDKNEITNALDNGNQVVMLGRDKKGGPGTPFGTDNHFITAIGRNRNGDIIAEDPDLPQSTVTYSKDKVLGSMKNSVITGKARFNKNRNKLIGRANSNSSIEGYSTSTQKAINNNNGKNLGPDAIINVAKSQIGTTEYPAGTNKQKYGQAAGNNGAAWCCYFVWWVFNQAGASKLFYNGKVCGSCSELKRYFSGKGQIVSTPQKGDIVFFNFNGKSCCHVGIVESVNSDGSINTIEGNTGGNGKSQDNGGMVMNKHRKKNSINSYARPDYPYDYDSSKVIDMSKYGDTTDYKQIAINGGQMDSSLSTLSNSGSGEFGTTDSSNGSYNSSGTLFEQLKDVGVLMMKKIYGEKAYNALFGSSSNSGVSEDDGGTTTPGDSQYVSTDSGTIAGGDNAEKIWNYLRQKGYSKEGAAGLMGNLDQESGLDPSNLQNSYNKKLGMTDNEYTNAINNKTRPKSSFASSKDGGYGLAQWTYGNRKASLYENTMEKGLKINDLVGQLDYLNHELSTYKLKGKNYSTIKDLLLNTKDINEASDTVLNDFEAPAVRDTENRRSRAKKYYEMFKSKETVDPTTGNEIKDDVAKGRKEFMEKSYEVEPLATETMQEGNKKIEYNTTNNYYNNETGMGRDRMQMKVKQQELESNYANLLNVIVEILMKISTNTNALNSILDVLNSKLGTNVSANEVQSSISQSDNSDAKAKRALTRLMAKSNINKNGLPQMIENNDTQFIMNMMKSLASE